MGVLFFIYLVEEMGVLFYSIFLEGSTSKFLLEFCGKAPDSSGELTDWRYRLLAVDASFEASSLPNFLLILR